ncbi:MAG: NAD-dependent epimerase/dehydratase family protein, partial [Proteobacteria bacterium]
MSNTKVLITGGAGFIGSTLARKLKILGYEVTIFDNFSPQVHGENALDSAEYRILSEEFEVVTEDVRNTSALEKYLVHKDIVVHLAAETGTGQSMYKVSHYTDVNISATAHLMEILSKKQGSVRKLVIASSRSIYGEGKYKCSKHGVVYPESRTEANMLRREYVPTCPYCEQFVEDLATSEDAKIQPISVYGLTKFAQENIALTVGRAIGLPTIAFRFQNVYGPGQSLSNPYTGILSIFSTRAQAHKKIEIFEDGSESRDFVYIDDVVDAIVLGMETKRVDFGAYNVGTGVKSTVLDIARGICKNFQSESQIEVTHKFRLGDIRTNYSDNT